MGPNPVSDSGSDFGKVSVSVPDPNPDPDHIRHSFSNKNCCTKSGLFNVRSGIDVQTTVVCYTVIGTVKTFLISFYFGSGTKSGSGTESVMHSGSGSAKVPVRQHWP